MPREEEIREWVVRFNSRVIVPEVVIKEAIRHNDSCHGKYYRFTAEDPKTGQDIEHGITFNVVKSLKQPGYWTVKIWEMRSDVLGSETIDEFEVYFSNKKE